MNLTNCQHTLEDWLLPPQELPHALSKMAVMRHKLYSNIDFIIYPNLYKWDWDDLDDDGWTEEDDEGVEFIYERR